MPSYPASCHGNAFDGKLNHPSSARNHFCVRPVLRARLHQRSPDQASERLVDESSYKPVSGRFADVGLSAHGKMNGLLEFASSRVLLFAVRFGQVKCPRTAKNKRRIPIFLLCRESLLFSNTPRRLHRIKHSHAMSQADFVVLGRYLTCGLPTVCWIGLSE